MYVTSTYVYFISLPESTCVGVQQVFSLSPAQVRERRDGTLPGIVEQGREGTQVERQPVLLRDLLHLRGGVVDQGGGRACVRVCE